MEPSCDIASMPRFGKQSQFLDFGPRSQPGVTTLRIADSQGPRACRLDLRGPAVRTNPICPLRRVGRGNSRFVAGDGVSVRKTQNTVSGMCGILVFWYSGLAPRKTRFCGSDIVCSWHVAVWIFGAKTKPIPGYAGVARLGGGDREAIMPNKPNSCH